MNFPITSPQSKPQSPQYHSTLPIPFPKSHIRRTESENQLTDNLAVADYVDHRMCLRLIQGIKYRQELYRSRDIHSYRDLVGTDRHCMQSIIEARENGLNNKSNSKQSINITSPVSSLLQLSDEDRSMEGFNFEDIQEEDSKSIMPMTSHMSSNSLFSLFGGKSDDSSTIHCNIFEIDM